MDTWITPLWGDAVPRPLLTDADVVFVQRRDSRPVRSCATSAGWHTVTVTHLTTYAHLAPYTPQLGEHLVAASALRESTKYTALLALNSLHGAPKHAILSVATPHTGGFNDSDHRT